MALNPGDIAFVQYNATAGVVSGSSQLNFSASGDQIIAFQGSLASPTPIAALNNRGTTFQTTAADTNTSALPQGLVLGTSAVAIAEIDNARYTGITTGDKATLQAALFNPANWSGDDTANQTFSGAFTIGGSTPMVSISATSDAAEAGTANGSFRVSRSGGTTSALVVPYSVSTGTGQATPGTDYTALSGTATIAAGSSFVDVIVTPVDDAIVEGNEAVTLTLTGSAGFTLGTATASVTIVDNDTVATITKISAIQGTGTAATAGTYTIEGIVVGDYQGTNGLGGFYLQEETTDSDGNELTSEGIFVNSLSAVNIGDKVRVAGAVLESSATPSFNQAVITPSSATDVTVIATGQQALVTATIVNLPITTLGDLERYDTLRIGSTTTGLTGVLGFGFNNYRIQPTQAPVFNYEARPALPEVGGGLKVGSFNVLNYFNGDGAGGGFPTSRGADTAVEFSRQRAKIISAIKELNADVVGLIEMENDGDGANSAIVDLVNGLNTAIGSNTYDYIKLANTTGSSGTDEIKVAFIYKPGAVTPIGNAVYFNDSAFTSLGRPPLAQTFINNASGEKFTPIVNHFKSKGAGGATGLNLDQGDGQGAFNDTRKTQATALLNFVSQIQTDSGDSDVMILGDLNAYNEEDPIDILRAGGLTKLTTATDSYVFDGQTGSLDHALVTSSLLAQVTGAAKWNINSSEPIVFDYNDDVISTGEPATEDRNDTSLYAPNQFRSSDHDPVLVGLDLKPTGGTTGADRQVGTDGNDTLFGNAGNDIINGGAGNDFIIGGLGVDLLFGGAGNDTFVYYGANEGIDKINDFAVEFDRISISGTGFGGATVVGDVGVLDAARFTLGSSATTTSQRFIYNNTSGALFFDADGVGGTAQVRIAQLVGNPALTNASFSIF